MQKERKKKKTDTSIAISSNDKKLSPLDFRSLVETPPLYPSSGWTRNDIQAAIQSHDQGHFGMSELLYHAMRKNPRIGSALEQRASLIKNFPFSLQVAKDAPEIIKRKTFVFEQMFDEKVLLNHAKLEILRRLLMFGFCICRHDFTTVNSQVVPQPIPWTNSYTYYNAMERVFYVSTRPGQMIPIVGDPWVIFTTGGSRPWLNGLIRMLAQPFADMNQANDRWNYFNDVEASAIRHMKGPRDTRESPETQAYVTRGESVRGGDVIYSPEGFDFELVTSGGRGGAYTAFSEKINQANADISIIFFGNNLAQEIKGGSFAASQTVSDRILEIAQSDVEYFAEGIYSSTSKLWIEKNFTPSLYGETSLLQYKPRPVWAVKKIVDKKNEAESSSKYSASISSFISTATQAGVNLEKLNIDWEKTALKCGVTLKTNKLPEVADNGD